MMLWSVTLHSGSEASAVSLPAAAATNASAARRPRQSSGTPEKGRARPDEAARRGGLRGAPAGPRGVVRCVRRGAWRELAGQGRARRGQAQSAEPELGDFRDVAVRASSRRSGTRFRGAAAGRPISARPRTSWTGEPFSAAVEVVDERAEASAGAEGPVTGRGSCTTATSSGRAKGWPASRTPSSTADVAGRRPRRALGGRVEAVAAGGEAGGAAGDGPVDIPYHAAGLRPAFRTRPRGCPPWIHEWKRLRDRL